MDTRLTLLDRVDQDFLSSRSRIARTRRAARHILLKDRVDRARTRRVMDRMEVQIGASGRGTIRVSGMARRRMVRMEDKAEEGGVKVVEVQGRGTAVVRQAGNLASRRRSRRGAREGCWASC